MLRGPPVDEGLGVDEAIDGDTDLGSSESLARLLSDPGLFGKETPPAFASPQSISLRSMESEIIVRINTENNSLPETPRRVPSIGRHWCELVQLK